MLSRLMTVREQLLLLGLAIAIIVGVATLFYLRSDAEPALIAVDAPDNSRDTPSAAKERPALPVLPLVPTSPANPALAPGSPPPTPPAPVKITVDIEGAVARPGVYDLDSGMRVRDLIEKAGGTLENADLSDIKLTAQLMDDSTLTIPFQASVQRGDNSISVRRPPNARALNPPQYTKSGGVSMPPVPPPANASPAAVFAPTAPPVSGPINLNTATAEQLEALPGIGPTYAKRIIEYRAAQPFASVEDLNNVPGIGEKRLETLRPLVTVQ